MASYNRVILMGNIVQDIELRYTPSGLAVTEVRLAVNDRRKNQAGEWVDEANFFDVKMFGRTAEIASEYLSKGSPVFVEGRLKYDSWEKDGQKRSKVHVICDRMQLIGSRGEGGGPSGAGGGGSASRAGSPSQANRSYERQPAARDDDADVYQSDDIPF